MRAITDNTGAVKARFDYDAWGNLLPSSTLDSIFHFPYQFVGALGCRADATTGLIYMRQRWYDPAIQRFISRDPLGVEAGQNLYSYVLNNPTNYIDPSGLKIQLLGDCVNQNKLKSLYENATGLKLNVDSNGNLSSVGYSGGGNQAARLSLLGMLDSQAVTKIQVETHEPDNLLSNWGTFRYPSYPGMENHRIYLATFPLTLSGAGQAHVTGALMHETAEAWYATEHNLYGKEGYPEAHAYANSIQFNVLLEQGIIMLYDDPQTFLGPSGIYRLRRAAGKGRYQNQTSKVWKEQCQCK